MDDHGETMRGTSVGWIAMLLLLGACSETHVVADSEDTESDEEVGDTDQEQRTDDDEGSTSTDDPAPALELPPECEPSADTEASCSDSLDDDCDGFTDCRDTECEGQACGEGEGFTCQSGACLAEGQDGLPPLPAMDNISVQMLGTTAIISYQPVSGAKDYRIYPLPEAEDVLVGEDGEVVIPGAIYRCAGDRPATRRQDDANAHYDASLTTDGRAYERPDGSESLGYVYVTPGPDRDPVYRISDPNRKGGYIWPHHCAWDQHQEAGTYTTSAELRDELVAAGQHDSGIAFYVPRDGDAPVYQHQYDEDVFLEPLFFYVDGLEAEARADDGGEISTPFSIFSEEHEGTVPLYRVFYLHERSHDTLAAGEPAFERALEQGNVPYWSLTWPGLQGDTTLVIEALDEGCPFPDGYISAHPAPGNIDEGGYYPSITLEQARLETDEVFVNGQHDPDNRPRPIARGFVDVTPEADPEMDWYENFDDPAVWGEFEETSQNWDVNWHNDDWIVEHNGCSDGVTVGPLLGQLALGGGDTGSSCNMSVINRNLDTEIRDGEYLHVRMTTEIPSTSRRYPQIMVTTAPVIDPEETHVTQANIRPRLGPLPFADDYTPGSGDYHTLIVQPFSSTHELQIQFCNRRGWGVSAQCPRANVYGYQSSNPEGEDVAWNPVPILGELAAHDRPVRFDAYMSTDRVYVYVDNKPGGCAVLPSDEMPESDVTVIFGSVIYHGGIDESVAPETSAHQYLRRYSLVHYDRRFDEVGVSQNAELPGWDESRLPCGKEWYGADE